MTKKNDKTSVTSENTEVAPFDEATPGGDIANNKSTKAPTTGTPLPPKKKAWWGRLIKWIMGIVLSLVALLALFTVLLYIPKVQQWVVGSLSEKLAKTAQIKLEVGYIRVAFPLKLKLENVKATDLKTGRKMAEVALFTTDVSIMPLIRGEEVPISGVLLEDAQVDFSLSNDSIRIAGTIGKMGLDRMFLDQSTLSIDASQLHLKDTDVCIDILTDTVSEPKPSDPSQMIISLHRGDLENVSADIWLYPDSTEIATYIRQSHLKGVEVNLSEKSYSAKKIDIEAGATALGEPIEMLPMPWYAYLSGSDVRYAGPDDIVGNIHALHFKVADTILVNDASFKIKKDMSRLRLKDFKLAMPQSHIYSDADLPFNKWLPDSIGMADLHLSGEVNPMEIRRFIGNINGLPDELISVDISAKGMMEGELAYALKLHKTDIANIELKGKARQIMDKQRNIDAYFVMTTAEETMKTLNHLMDKDGGGKEPSWTIPSGLSAKGSAHYSPRMASADILLKDLQRGGTLDAKAVYYPTLQKYSADIILQELSLQAFLPKDSIGPISASLNIQGKGTDLFSDKTEANLYLDIDSIGYKAYSLKDVMLVSQLQENQLYAALSADNDALKIIAQSDIVLKQKSLEGSINILVDTIIPSQLGLTVPILESGKMELRSNIRSDLQEYYDFQGEVENFILVTDKGILHPRNTYIKALSTDSLLSAEVASGDLSLRFDAKNGLKDFTHRINKVIEEATKSLSDSLGQVNMAPWIEYYPNMEVSLKMGRDNVLRTYFDEHRIGATSILFDLKTKPGEGLEGLGVVTTFQADTFRIDNIDLILRQDSSFFTAVSTVHKEHFRNQEAFDIMLSLTSNVQRSEVYVDWTDSHSDKFIQMGLELFNRPNGDLTFGFTPDPIVVAYNTFNVLNDDYITLPHTDRNKIKANLALSSDTGARISVKDLPSDRGHLLRAEVQDFQLGLLDRIPMMPDLSGLVNATADWLQVEDKTGELTAQLNVDDFRYNKKEIGTIEIKASAVDNDMGSLLRANLLLNNEEVAYVNGFAPKGDEKARYQIMAHDLPLVRANPFIPEKYARLSGMLFTELSNYDTSKPIAEASTGLINGWLQLKDANVFSPIVNETYLIDSNRLEIKESKVWLRDFGLTANNSRLVTNGHLILTENIPTDIRIMGNNVLLLDSQKTGESMLYGRLNTNTDIRIKGPISAFSLNGRIDINGDTDVTYQSQNEELHSRNGYEQLVTFTDFADTLFAKKRNAVDSLSLGGMDIRLAVHIDPATQITAILNKAGSNMIRLQGGGDFNLGIPPYGTITLNGTYNIQKGDAQMAFTYLSRRFTIQNGSSISWNGILMEPDINVKATSTVRSNVTLPGEQTKQIDFLVSAIAENSLDDLKLRFETEAPQDLAMKNTLAELSPEEQNKQSIMLLATGHYFGSGGIENAKGFDVNSAISSFFANQINSLAGEALNAEINFGISDGTNAYGQGTNYSYSITKRFLNNRISLKVGGKMLTGAAAIGLQQTFIDNMSLDYQLDQAGTHYLRLFHNKNFENLLDGEVVETGIGYVVHRKLNKLRELFKLSNPLRSKEPVPPAIWKIDPAVKSKEQDNANEEIVK